MSERPGLGAAGAPSAAAAPPVVEFRGVSFSYTGDPVLQQVSFEVRAGEFVSAVGPNGGARRPCCA